MSEEIAVKLSRPGISIITVVRNHISGLKRTLESLSSQTFVDWELIILLGESTDGTEDLARGLESTDSRVSCVSQIGMGIYPAMNQALTHVNGQYVWFMNAGDAFAEENSISAVIEIMEKKSCEVLIGGYRVLENNSLRTYSKSNGVWGPLGISLNRRGLCHQSTVMKTSLIRDLQGFNSQYLIASDFDLILRASKISTIHRTDMPLSNIEPGGISSLRLDKVLNEKQLIRVSNFGQYSLHRFLGSLWTLSVKFKVTARTASMRTKEGFKSHHA